MAPMQVILTESVEKLGKGGDLVQVAKGYARNFLIPKGMAVPADPKKVRQLEHQKRVIDDRKKKDLKEVDALAEKLEEISCTIPVRVGQEDRIFGSVTTGDIAKGLRAQGIEVDRRKITLEEPIKALGVYTVLVKVSSDRTSHLKVWVVKEEATPV